MSQANDGYIPALRYEWLTSLYDPVIRLTMREATFKAKLVEQARIEQGHRVLDLGCGTGTLLLLLRHAHPDVELIGLDIDPQVLNRAWAKLDKVGTYVRLDEGAAFALPYQDRSFDRALSSLLLHHLTRDNKQRTLQEVFRILRPGGELHVADFGQPHNRAMAAVSLIVRWFEEAADNVKGLLPVLIREAGFDPVEEIARFATVFGTVALYRALKPREESSHLR